MCGFGWTTCFLCGFSYLGLCFLTIVGVYVWYRREEFSIVFCFYYCLQTLPKVYLLFSSHMNLLWNNFLYKALWTTLFHRYILYSFLFDYWQNKLPALYKTVFSQVMYSLQIEGKRIMGFNEAKFLGIIIDKLNWKPRFIYIYIYIYINNNAKEFCIIKSSIICMYIYVLNFQKELGVVLKARNVLATLYYTLYPYFIYLRTHFGATLTKLCNT